MKSRVLIVDDEIDSLDSLRRGLRTAGYRAIEVESDPRRALGRFEAGERFEVVLLDVTMPHMSGVDLLEKVKCVSPGTECVMVTARNEARLAVECLRKGAYDYLIKPISRDELVLAMERVLERIRFLAIADLPKRRRLPELEDSEAFRSLVTDSRNMRRILKEAELHARSNLAVLITGESGTGKELLARAIHRASLRSDGPFLAINMLALTANLFDSEFFGHTRGAFTGADRDHAGYLERCRGGTLFLDEIGHLPADLQGKLLRVLQEQEFLKLGSTTPQKADIRFIAATNADLDDLMERGLFRRDLFYRLRGAWIDLPPLRDRRADIPLLAETFLAALHPEGSGGRIEPAALELLSAYEFPGNVRELRSILQSAANLSQGKAISVGHLPRELARATTRPAGPPTIAAPTLTLEEVERRHLLAVYAQTGHNKAQTAKLLAIGLNTLRRRLTEFGVG